MQIGIGMGLNMSSSSNYQSALLKIHCFASTNIGLSVAVTGDSPGSGSVTAPEWDLHLDITRLN